MSAFALEVAHIDALVTLALCGPDSAPRRHWHPPHWLAPIEPDGSPAAPGDPWRDATLVAGNTNYVGAMLMSECIRSVAYRYPDCARNAEPAPPPSPAPDPAAYCYRAPRSFARRASAVEGLKLLHCYEYQSCEHPGWHASQASSFCSALTRALVSTLPGYDEAPWQVSD